MIHYSQMAYVHNTGSTILQVAALSSKYLPAIAKTQEGHVRQYAMITHLLKQLNRRQPLMPRK